MKNYKVLIAKPEDHKELTSTAIGSKRHWGYPEDWIDNWIDELTIKPGYIQSNYVFKLVRLKDQEICGFCSFEYNRKDQEFEIGHFWLKPDFIGKNLGNYLYNSCFEDLKSLPLKRVRVTADPNAQGFYEKLGFVQVDSIESTPKGRFLPILVLDL